jgi:uncharacterized protein YjiS (DUF1127 family)
MTDFALSTAPRSGRGLIATLRTALARSRVFKQTLNELAALSDRDLSDIGISRYDIRALAREKAASTVL